MSKTANAKVVNATVLRNHLSEVLDEVESKEPFLLIARNDDIGSVIVDIDFFEELLAKNSPEYVKSIRNARKQYESGETFTHADIFGKL
ncbi:MAG: type II toxin-antitoxin system Phd/YefM family antitoxin [Deltaproteobacteria bacterium]|nr:type II toxin-antitoxin system Phd/YefM family antitoxin [Deltaproteobacteria bacterium]